MAGFVPICQNADLALSLLLVSDNRSYLKKISESLKEVNPDNELKVFTCESVTQVLNVKDTPQIDYVVFCINGDHANSVLQIEQNIMKLDKKFLLNRICVICDSSLSSTSLQPKILDLKVKYQLHVLWGDIATDSNLVCTRLLRLVSAVCGLVSGFPLFTHKVWHRNTDETTNTSAVASMEDLF